MPRLTALALFFACWLFSPYVEAQQDTTVHPSPESGSFRSATSLQYALSNRTGTDVQASFSNDTCFTWTYKLKTGNAAGFTTLTESYKTSNGIIYSVGYTKTSSAGVQQALLQKLDSTGNIAWSKNYEVIVNTISSLVFHSIRETSDGSLLVTGTLTMGGNNKMMLAKIDLQGTPVWTKTIDADDYLGAGITAMPSGSAGFTGYKDSMIIFGVLDVSGNVVWSKEVKAVNSVDAAWISRFDYDGWYVTCTGTDSSRKAGVIIKVNTNTQQVTWMQKLGGPAANTDFIFHDLEFTNIRPRISGIYAVSGGNYRVFNLTVNATGWLEGMFVYEVPGVTIDATAKTTISQTAEVIAFSGTSADPDLYVVKMSNDYNVTPHWRKKFTGLGTHTVVNTQRCLDGGYIFSNNLSAGAASQGYYIKVDSIGSIKNCEPPDFPVNVTISGITGSFLTPVVSGMASAAYSLPLAESLLSLPSTSECRSLNCPPPVITDSCITGFSRKYRSATLCDLGSSVVVLNDNDILVAGGMRDDPYNSTDGNYALIARINKRGQLISKQKTMIGHRSGYISADTLQDGNLLLVASSGYTSPNSTSDTAYWVITKMTRNLTIIWSKSFVYNSPYSSFYGVVESGDGSLFVNYIEDPAFCQKASVMKLDASGNFIWLRDYRVTNACIVGSRGSITQDNDHVYFANFASAGSAGSLLMKLRKTDGSVVWSRRMQLNTVTQMEAVRDIAFIGNKLVMHGNVTSSSSSVFKSLVQVIDTSGNLVAARYFRIGTQNAAFSKMLVTRDRHIVLEGSSSGYSRFLRLDSNLNIVQSKKAFTQFTGARDIKEGNDGSFYTTGSILGGNVYEVDLTVKKYNSEGIIGSCASDTMIYDTGIQPMVITAVTPQVTSRTISLYSVPQASYAHSLQENQIACHEPANCTSLSVDAPAGICNTQPHTITVTRNNGCSLPVFFVTDNKIQVLSRTDTSLSVKAASAGTSVIKARIYNGCYWAETEISINITLSQLSLDLGPDQLLCSGNSYALHAGPQFFNYLWNTGSTDSVITVTAPGKYHVSAHDACGTLYADTIQIDPAPAVPLDLGSDRVKCNNDTIHLAAPDGFTSYSWGPSYNISALNSQYVIVQPAVDTMYHVKAEKTPGCFGYDTVHIKVNHSPPVYLGSDTSFCAGNSILLDAGPGFQQYQWSNGNTSRQIEVGGVGEFSVIGTDVNGCRSYDTLRVLQVWTKPVVTLDKTPALCFGNTRTLQAGSFSSYLWQDGSTASSFMVSATGVYYVTATNSNGCKGSDTVVINKIHPVPAKFLPADTAICSFGSIFLSPFTTFNMYSWSSGSNYPTIEITSPGSYYLQVTDGNGCTGKDTIEVRPKQCLGGIFIPTAFTPNKDGKNDLFKPYVGGALTSYRMDIYNRFGQLIFSSSNAGSGWDGTVNGTPQATGGYVYYCRYHFQGEEPGFQKGTFVLIR